MLFAKPTAHTAWWSIQRSRCCILTRAGVRCSNVSGCLIFPRASEGGIRHDSGERTMVRITPSDNDIAVDYALPVRLARSVRVRRNQPMQVNSIGSIERQRLVSNIV